jgi:Outer membrane protein beta-barrel domain
MNRTIVITGFAALALAAVTSTQAATQAFIRPVIAYVSPDADGYDDAGYLGVQAGVFTGPTKQHEFSGEIGATGWESDERFGTTRVEATETYVPVLASYRYYVQPETSKVRFFFGPSIGFTHASYEIELSGPNVFGKDDSIETFFTFAGNVGVDIKFNEKFSLNVGYRYLHIDGGETELFGADIDLDDSKAHVVFAGLNIRF